MGFTWTPTSGAKDAGIDGFIGIRDPKPGEALNQIVQVQSKATPNVPRAHLERQQLLSQESFELLTSDSPEATRLRQSRLFCEILPVEEQKRIFKEFERRRTGEGSEAPSN
jgi:hypothetical protein